MSGRGRGRGRRGRGGNRRSHVRGQEVWEQPGDTTENRVQDEEKTVHVLNIESEPRDYFLGTVSVDDHVKGQTESRIRYAAALSVLATSGVTISQNARVRALAAAWARNDLELASALLEDRGRFGLVEVLKAITLLDSGRQMRVMEKKMRRLQLSGTKVNSCTMGKLKSELDNLRVIRPTIGSASGSTCKHIQRWVRSFTKEELEFYALYFPKESWRKLADICHFNPSKDFAALPWFLTFCFGGPAPDDTMVEQCQNITDENVNTLVAKYNVPYSHVKQFVKNLTTCSKSRIAGYETKLDTILWYYEDLQCPEVDTEIQKRLEQQHPVTMPYGKLLERLLTLKMIRENIPFDPSYSGWDVPRTKNPTKASFHPNLVAAAEQRLRKISLPLESPVVIMGDASGSMDVAVRTSTIIASMLTAVTSAKLVFFNEWTRDAPFLPKTVKECLELAVTIRAEGGTSPAASLYPFYTQREIVKTFIVVTDEEERDEYENYRFCPLFKKYHEEVYPAKLVFVSFLSGQHATGPMVEELRDAGFKPLQFRFESTRPDLTKLDSLFGLLASDSAYFENEIQVMECLIKKDGLTSVFQKTGQIKDA